MIYPTTFKPRRPDAISMGLRKAFEPVTEMTEPLEAALKRLIVLDFALADASDDAFDCHGASPTPVWESARASAQRVPA